MGGQVQSKFQPFHQTCQQFVHPYNDSCSKASAGLFLAAVQQSFRIYVTAYLLALLMKGRIPSSRDIKRTILGIFQSTFFLTCHAFGFSVSICTLRYLCGNFNMFTAAFIPCFISSVGAILVERPSRRTLLSLYVTNIASETLFRMFVSRGYIKSIPLGEVILFSGSIATLLYFYKSACNNDDSIYSLLRFVVGESEKIGYVPSEPSPQSGLPKATLFQNSILNILNDKLDSVPKSEVCVHKDNCVTYVLQGGGKLFTIGYALQVCLKLLLNMKQIAKRPILALNVLFRPSTLKLGAFLGGFSAIFRAISCILRCYYNKDSKNFAFPAGIIAGLSFCFYKDNTIALYVFWKMLQILYVLNTNKGYVPEFTYASIFFHSFSSAILFHAAIFEPQNLRPSYWKFLQNVSGGRFAAINRQFLAQYGTNAEENLKWVLEKYKSSNVPIQSFGLG